MATFDWRLWLIWAVVVLVAVAVWALAVVGALYLLM